MWVVVVVLANQSAMSLWRGVLECQPSTMTGEGSKCVNDTAVDDDAKDDDAKDDDDDDDDDSSCR